MKTFAEQLLEAIIEANEGSEEEMNEEPRATKHERFAKELRELMDALQAEGFSRSEALMLTKAAIVASGKL